MLIEDSNKIDFSGFKKEEQSLLSKKKKGRTGPSLKNTSKKNITTHSGAGLYE